MGTMLILLSMHGKNPRPSKTLSTRTRVAGTFPLFTRVGNTSTSEFLT